MTTQSTTPEFRNIAHCESWPESTIQAWMVEHADADPNCPTCRWLETLQHRHGLEVTALSILEGVLRAKPGRLFRITNRRFVFFDKIAAQFAFSVQDRKSYESTTHSHHMTLAEAIIAASEYVA